jgi:hypothetical protein
MLQELECQVRPDLHNITILQGPRRRECWASSDKSPVDVRAILGLSVAYIHERLNRRILVKFDGVEFQMIARNLHIVGDEITAQTSLLSTAT